MPKYTGGGSNLSEICHTDPFDPHLMLYIEENCDFDEDLCSKFVVLWRGFRFLVPFDPVKC